ncbi:hypothetical protein C8Q73DRAFT_499487 [Cubamyces lactineus]|nr:hypothetical protein C8Q73DRAFT_499487 [Cubamyces lactineus]
MRGVIARPRRLFQVRRSSLSSYSVTLTTLVRLQSRSRLRRHCALHSCCHASLGLVNAWLVIGLRCSLSRACSRCSPLETHLDRVDDQILRETCAFTPSCTPLRNRLTYAHRYRRRSSKWLMQSCSNRRSCWGLRDVRVDGNRLIMSGLRGRTRRRACCIVGVYMNDVRLQYTPLVTLLANRSPLLQRRLIGPGRPSEIRYYMHSASSLLTTTLRTSAVRVLLARPGPQVEALS